MPDLVDHLIRFWTQMDARLEVQRQLWWGTVVADRRFPDVWDTNYARVETADPSLALEEVAAALSPALETAGAAMFHVVLFRPSQQRRLLTELTARGDRRSEDLVMVHEGPVPQAPHGAVEELAVDDRLWRGVAATLPAFGVTEPDTIEQLLRLEREVMDPGGAKRWFGVADTSGELVAIGALVELAGLAYVDHVVTLPHARGRGHAGAIVTALLAAARRGGADPTFLLVDPQGPVALYERLGFREATRLASTLRERQTGGGGR
jgi:ribosomal protein S18 acetylase RimI-like enzyme